MRRLKLISEIFELADTNKSTLVLILATLNDKALTKFHKKFIEKAIKK